MVRMLGWLLDAIILFVIVRAVMRLFGGRRSARREPADAPPFQRTPVERIGGTLVRDPHCGTYIPESSAIRVRVGAEMLCFCSPACRDAFQARA